MQKKKRKEQNDEEFLDTFGSILSGKKSSKGLLVFHSLCHQLRQEGCSQDLTGGNEGKRTLAVSDLDDDVERLSKDVQNLSTREKLEVGLSIRALRR
jgi:hypothetical protein